LAQTNISAHYISVSVLRFDYRDADNPGCVNLHLRSEYLQAGLPASRMKDQQSPGDTTPEEFRKQLHELADWIADFRENIESLRVAPNPAVAAPGAIRAQLPRQPPEDGEPFEKILSDVDRLIVPGMVHWSHPMFLGYFGWTTTAPGILGEILSAPLNVNAMTWRTCPAATELETV